MEKLLFSTLSTVRPELPQFGFSRDSTDLASRAEEPPVSTGDSEDDPDDLVELRRKRDKVQSKIDQLDKQDSVLDSYADSIKAKHATAAQLSEFLDLFSARVASIANAKVELSGQLKEFEKAINKTEKEHNKDEQSTKRQTKIVVVVLAESDGPAELSLSYAVQNASWTPLYDVRATIDGGQKDGKSQVSLHYRASIKQSTAEDWTNVHLTLSTASPHTGSEIPRLNAYRLSEYVPYVPPRRATKSFRKKEKEPSRSSMLMDGIAVEYDEEEEEGGSRPLLGGSFGSRGGGGGELFKKRFVKASDHGQGFSSTFHVEGLSSIPSNVDSDESHKVTIAVLDLKEVSLKWIAVPKEVESVFLQVGV